MTSLTSSAAAHPNQSLKNTLAMQLPKRLVECLQQLGQLPDVTLKTAKRFASSRRWLRR
ncbi:oxidoreductase [Klebsiella michiganensis]|uniref:Oxidoreductase n=1 Tax=Klebsiella michiganensis TaxID=1134687 RepID=A0A7H4PG19_9ENTR|nr:oxidoreductase [Klebsiella michiganensis]